jgi:hypothetical protein
MSKTPFIYGNTVSFSGFTNREKDREKLFRNLTNGINSMLISPRRWGKSSLVERVVSDLNKNESDIRTVSFDLFSVSSENEFLELFAQEVIKASSSKWQDWLKSGKDFFQLITPKLSFGIDPATDFSVGFDWEELKKHKNEILNLPEIIAKKKNIRFVICLDEFQNLATFDNFSAFEKKMRAVWQRQKLVTYCLFGSKRHMMTDIFNNPSKPFYRFGDIIMLQKITTAKWLDFIEMSFTSTNKFIAKEIAIKIPQLMKNHSWYVQQLSHYTWQNSGKTVKLKDLNDALEELIFTNTPLYQKEIESLNHSQINLMKAIAKGEPQLSSMTTIESYRLGTSASVVKNKRILINNDIIDKFEGSYEFLDPAFELWFCKLFFGKNFKILNE